LGVSGSLVSEHRFDEMPERVEFDATAQIAEAVGRVDPIHVSQALGTSLSRTQSDIEVLVQVATGNLHNVDTPLRRMKALERQVLGQSVSFRSQSALADPGDGPMTSPGLAGSESLEETVAAVRVEAQRLRGWAARAEPGQPGPDPQRVRSAAERLQEMADSVLSRALFSVVLDQEGQIAYANGAFVAMTRLGAPEDGQRNLRELWRDWLCQAPPGRSVSADPVAGPPLNWEIRRTDLSERSGTGRSGTMLVFRRLPSVPVEPEMLHGAEPLISALQRAAALITHGSASAAEWAEGDLETCVNSLAHVFDASAPVPAAV
jgi:PAS domain-containing protein